MVTETPTARFSPVVGAAIMLIGTMNSAIAGCKAGDLAGKWDLYTLMARSPDIMITPSKNYSDSNTAQILGCSLNFAPATTAPITYTISGNCKEWQVFDGLEASTASVAGTLTEATDCHVTGTLHVTTINHVVNITILKAKIDDSTAARSRGTGIWKFSDFRQAGVPATQTVAIFQLQK